MSAPITRSVAEIDAELDVVNAERDALTLKARALVAERRTAAARVTLAKMSPSERAAFIDALGISSEEKFGNG